MTESASHSGLAKRINGPRWIRVVRVSLLAVLLLCLLGGGGAGYFAYRQYPTLTALGEHFCKDLLGQNYNDAYHLLSTRLHSQFSADLFSAMGQTLDELQGPAQSCGQQSLATVWPGVFPIALTVTSALTRAKSGSRQGPIRLVYENETWKIDDLGASLLGVSPYALAVALRFCDDTSAMNYVGVWSLYSSALQKQDPRAALEHAQSQLPPSAHLDGPSCTLTALNGPSDAMHATVTFQVSASPQLIHATLSPENGAWKIATISPDSLASMATSDITAEPVLTVVNKWLASLTSGDCASGYHMLASETQQRLPLSSFTSQVCLATNWAYVSTDIVLYQSNTQASVELQYTAIMPGATPAGALGANEVTPTPHAMLMLIRESGVWKVKSLQAM